ncbi:wall-associated receptor kinase 5 [Elaeis guineensis]|uniref:Wall-associated receptor kinase 5 n=1 Tax=Elaeis guineensis var. tenera TaxID=51953 RepID=A0A6I9R3Z2_ELAGV|nr:wall-associated receptor kinase 5 [Elaeis guineensis]
MALPVLILLQLLWSAPPSSSKFLGPSALEADAVGCGWIPYPFGVNGSSFRRAFELTCDPREGGSVTLPLGSTNLKVLNISLKEGYIRAVLEGFSWRCARDSTEDDQNVQKGLDLEGTPFTFSDARNKFTVIGCDAMAIINVSARHSTGCVSFCITPESVIDGSCSGVGCCQASIPKGLKRFQMQFLSIRNLTHSLVGPPVSSKGSRGYGQFYNNSRLPSEETTTERCTKAFVLEQGQFSFSASEIRRDINLAEWHTTASVILDWAIGNETCEEVRRRNVTDCACKENSLCYDVPNRAGYRCTCQKGYDGNPYSPGGCKDIDECTDGSNPCVGRCKNTDGGFLCPCPLGTSGDGKRMGTRCKRTTPLVIGLGVGLGLLIILVVGSLGAYRELKKRKIAELKQEHFLRNGGLLLQQHISTREVSPRIFSIAEIERATDGFAENRVVGRGGYGTVYKGILSDESVVAIKKSKLVDESQIEQFINEVVVLSKINHENVVKLLGCCLESQVPMLVYEFIPNGTLFHHIHNSRSSSSMSWENRLRIATETAGALAYLHYKAPIPIIHRDVKSPNILLDENYTAKVSDFGASRLVPFDRSHVTTLVQGTLGYLDPEYFYTSQLTEKSDVYSFGVVLVELLTTEKPVSFRRSERERNLASHFVTLLEENRLLEEVDYKLVREAGRRHLLAVAQLAMRCLILKGEERPTMREVAVELGALRRLMMKQRSEQQSEVGDPSVEKPLNVNDFESTRPHSMECHLLSPMDTPV